MDSCVCSEGIRFLEAAESPRAQSRDEVLGSTGEGLLGLTKRSVQRAGRGLPPGDEIARAAKRRHVDAASIVGPPHPEAAVLTAEAQEPAEDGAVDLVLAEPFCGERRLVGQLVTRLTVTPVIAQRRLRIAADRRCRLERAGFAPT